MIEITEMRLDTAEFLSLVDKGASGDPDNRPEIVLFKRHPDAGAKSMEKRMPFDAAALDMLGLNDKQKEGVLALVQALLTDPKEVVKPSEPEAPAVPMEEAKAENPPMQEEKMEDKEMAKRLQAERDEKIALEKRVKELEDAAEMVRIEKRADELKFIPASRDEVIDMVKRGVPSEILDRLNEAGKESPILRVAGASTGEGGSTIEATIAKRASALMDKNPELDATNARLEILKRDPELYRRLRQEEAAI